MKFSKETDTHTLHIKSYHPGSLQIGEQSYDQTIILTSGSVTVASAIKDMSSLSNAEAKKYFDTIIQNKPDVVIFGLKESSGPLSSSVTQLFLCQHIGVEAMPTQAACRTFNLLASEGRHVVGVLIP